MRAYVAHYASTGDLRLEFEVADFVRLCSDLKVDPEDVRLVLTVGEDHLFFSVADHRTKGHRVNLRTDRSGRYRAEFSSTRNPGIQRLPFFGLSTAEATLNVNMGKTILDVTMPTERKEITPRTRGRGRGRSRKPTMPVKLTATTQVAALLILAGQEYALELTLNEALDIVHKHSA